MITKDDRFFEHLTELLTHIEDMVDDAPETVRLWNRVTKAVALSRAPASPLLIEAAQAVVDRRDTPNV